MSGEWDSLATGLWRDLERPDVWWQVGMLAFCLLLAALLDRTLRARPAAGMHHSVGKGGVRRLIFPMTALVLVLIGRALLRGHFPVTLLSVAVPLLLSLAAIRIVFYVLRISFSAARWLGAFERMFAFCAWSLVALHVLGCCRSWWGCWRRSASPSGGSSSTSGWWRRGSSRWSWPCWRRSGWAVWWKVAWGGWRGWTGICARCCPVSPAPCCCCWRC
ncbi:hypothetical protein [Denitratisoma sp. DHT3]|uniref:hypothetical protein n=1 Tax=Denitratisoma sp. DHT3 TaxID=1981880 RepID=UPI0021BD9870|nr:hypothetical protein [Denitratisoma sp. DHT3]